MDPTSIGDPALVPGLHPVCNQAQHLFDDGFYLRIYCIRKSLKLKVDTLILCSHIGAAKKIIPASKSTFNWN